MGNSCTSVFPNTNSRITKNKKKETDRKCKKRGASIERTKAGTKNSLITITIVINMIW